MTTKKKSAEKATAPFIPTRNVVPDSIDLRDRPYMPPVGLIPAEELIPTGKLPVLQQGQTNACTGFALASVIYQLQAAAKRKPNQYAVSPFMLYSMARRYDEFPGDPSVDSGSSLRGAIKGWYKHGVCSDKLWSEEKMPTAPVKRAEDDWWLDAVRRPLGAYYRVDPRSVTDMQIALNELGVIYASAGTHSGWDEGADAKAKSGIWTIPAQKIAPDGHAFAIVGYTRTGFIVHNSWGTDWGTNGRAVLTYEDWVDHAMDCWVAQLGVPTEQHMEIAASRTLRVNKAGVVQVASDRLLRNREITPFIIDMENNGKLSNTGSFRTQESDVQALVTQYLGAARKEWGLGAGDPVDVAIYAHGGLTSETDAAKTAGQWIPALYSNRIFPIFLMWETDLWSTLQDRTKDLLSGEPRAAGGMVDRVKGWWNERLEKLLAVPGTAIWGEMKQNADAISSEAKSGGTILYEACMNSPYFTDMTKVRLHLIGHSAGAILHSHIIDRLGGQGWNFESVNFMAPAVRLDTFEAAALPAIRSGKVKKFNQFQLSDAFEQVDPTCKPILGYSRSLLYLVSQSFEKGKVTPILGMEKYFEKIKDEGLANVNVVTAPGGDSQSTTHGGFDDDEKTMNKVISLILEK